jgi:hypothetical protein
MFLPLHFKVSALLPVQKNAPQTSSVRPLRDFIAYHERHRMLLLRSLVSAGPASVIRSFLP